MTRKSIFFICVIYVCCTRVVSLPFFVANSLENTVDESFNTIMTLNDVQQMYLDLEKEKNTDIQTKLSSWKLVPVIKHRNLKRYIQYKYKSPIRHARAVPDSYRSRGLHNKRRLMADLSLCHFKICNMGRKRATRLYHQMVGSFD